MTLNGETMTMKQWSEKLKVSYEMVQKRLLRGWSDVDSFSAPRYTIKNYKEACKKDTAISINQLEKLISTVTHGEDFTDKEKKMMLRYFMNENFKAWMSHKKIALKTGIQNASTVCLQIKKLNTEIKYKLIIQNIRDMVMEFNSTTQPKDEAL